MPTPALITRPRTFTESRADIDASLVIVHSGVGDIRRALSALENECAFTEPQHLGRVRRAMRHAEAAASRLHKALNSLNS